MQGGVSTWEGCERTLVHPPTRAGLWGRCKPLWWCFSSLLERLGIWHQTSSAESKAWTRHLLTIGNPALFHPLASCYMLFFLFFFFFQLHCIAHGTLVSHSGMELGSSAVKAWHPNHWTAKEVPLLLLKMLLRKAICLIGWYPITSPDGFLIDWLNQKASSCHHFSAFWLRSSVVSVLISLISDTSSIRGQYIKWIFGIRSWNRSLLRPLHASTWYCSTSRNGAPPSGGTSFSLKKRSNTYVITRAVFLSAARW